ncbi:MAG: 4-oxalocrotonate tautomerase family protein [Desulfobacterales bacterium]|nr:4-oxalocrotonate tautomerase family protein [Desulfobacterales bacterium]
MPIIKVTMTEEDGGATTEQKAALIEGFTRVFSEVMCRGGETAVVTIEEVSTDNYGIGGRSVTAIRKSQAAEAK